MKRTLLSLAVVSSFLTTAPVFANDCIDHIDAHYIKTIHWPDQKTGGYLNLDSCHLQNSDMPSVVAFLKQHPEADEIGLEMNNITAKGAATLAEMNNPIERLYISFNSIGDQGLAALTHMPALIFLAAADNHISDAGVKAAYFKHLEVINLQDNQITHEGAKALNAMPSLEYIGLGNNQLIGDETAILFSQNHNLFGVDLDESDVTDKGAIALASSPSLGEIELGATKISDAGAKAIANKSNLQYVTLGYDNIGIETISAIAKNPSIGAVNLSGNNLSDNSIQILANNPHIRNFYLDDNNIRLSGAAALAASNAEFIFVNKNALGDNGAVALSETNSVHYLFVANNGIGSKGAASLGKMHLNYLFADNNHFGDEGVERLISSWDKTNPMYFLNLSNNQIGDVGAISLSKLPAQQFGTITLDVSYNHISHVGLTALREASAFDTVVTDGNDDNKAKVNAKESRRKVSRAFVKLAALQRDCKDKDNAACTQLIERHLMDPDFRG